MRALTDDDFSRVVGETSKPVLVDFWAEWCVPCRKLTPTLERISQKRSDVMFVKVDADAEALTSARYNVRAIPSMLLFKRGKVVATLLGAKSSVEINAWLDENLKD